MVWGDMQRENVVLVPFGPVSNALFERFFDVSQISVPVLRTPHEVVVGSVHTVVVSVNLHPGSTDSKVLSGAGSY